MADVKPALPARTRARASRIPAETIQPSAYRPPRHERPRSDTSAIAERFQRALFSNLVAYEIQARCGVFPLTGSETEKLDGLREIAGQDEPLRDALQAAADKLVDAQSCGHCMMRDECAFRQGARRG